MRRWVLVLGLGVFTVCTHFAAAADGPATAPAEPRLTGIDGKPYQPVAVKPHRAAVLVFVLQDCPICNGYAPQVNRLAARYSPEGVAFYLVHVDPTISVEDARGHMKDYGYSLPVLIDRRHELVSRLGVGVVPTAVVIDASGATKYQGRIDDQYVAIGKSRNEATTSDLRDAIAAVLAGKPVAEPKTQPIGCAVPDLPSAQAKR